MSLQLCHLPSYWIETSEEYYLCSVGEDTLDPPEEKLKKKTQKAPTDSV